MTCRVCGEVKEQTEFRKDKFKASGYQRLCRACDAARRRPDGISRASSAAYARPTEEERPAATGSSVDYSEPNAAVATLNLTEEPSISTLETLLEKCGVDLSVWSVERHVVNAWTLGNGSQDQA